MWWPCPYHRWTVWWPCLYHRWTVWWPCLYHRWTVWWPCPYHRWTVWWPCPSHRWTSVCPDIRPLCNSVSTTERFNGFSWNSVQEFVTKSRRADTRVATTLSVAAILSTNGLKCTCARNFHVLDWSVWNSAHKISVQCCWVSLSYVTTGVAQVILYSRAQATRPPFYAYSAPLASQSIQRTLSYHVAGIGSFMKTGAVKSIPYLLMGVNESVYTLLTFTVRFGRSSAHEKLTKWLKFGIRDLYKVVKIRCTKCVKMVEIRYARCSQNGWNYLYEMCTKWLKFAIRDVYKMVGTRYTRCI